MKHIFEPLRLHSMELKNRLVRSATWEGIAAPDGSLSKEAYAIYEELARGGIGAIAEGVPVITQLALGAFYREKDGRFLQVEPDDMTPGEIRLVIRQFVEAAVRAEKAGFDGVQIHAAHFFFLSRFISPAVNHRTDAYGGTLEHRATILLEIMDGIRREAPKLHITIKINCNDFTGGGLTVEESLAICKLLDQAGIDSIEVSGNGTSVGDIKPHVNEGYFVPAAADIAKAVRCPVMVVGGFRSLDFMEEVLNKTDIELISLSRPLLREPDLPNLMKGDPSVISKCVSCNACYSSPASTAIFTPILFITISGIP